MTDSPLSSSIISKTKVLESNNVIKALYDNIYNSSDVGCIYVSINSIVFQYVVDIVSDKKMSVPNPGLARLYFRQYLQLHSILLEYPEIIAQVIEHYFSESNLGREYIDPIFELLSNFIENMTISPDSVVCGLLLKQRTKFADFPEFILDIILSNEKLPVCLLVHACNQIAILVKFAIAMVKSRAKINHLIKKTLLENYFEGIVDIDIDGEIPYAPEIIMDMDDIDRLQEAELVFRIESDIRKLIL